MASINSCMLQLPTLEEVVSSFPSSQNLDKVCIDFHLVELTKYIVDWRDLTPYLNLTPAEERDIESVIPTRTPERQRIDVLRKWSTKLGNKATYRGLIHALYAAKRADLIDHLCTVVTKSSVHLLASNIFGTDSVSALSSYGNDILKQRYKAGAVEVSIQWPPPLTTKIFDLVLIKKDQIERGTIGREFIRMQTTGKYNIQDILQNQQPVELEKIFKFDSKNDTRRVVLIEGAPGSGKSTLSLNICQKWESSQMFTNYYAVILLRLHDPFVQQAKTIEDLLPYMDHNPTLRREIAEEIKSTFGEGVLWIFDGWDELSSESTHPHTQSIIHKLIRSNSQLYKCSVIITSRPTGSANLHQLITSRYEIVGLTPDKTKQYFQECLKHKPNPEEALANLQDQIEENPAIEASCCLPLNASIIANLYIDGNESLPRTLHGILLSLVQCILLRHMQGRLKESPPSELSQLELLGVLPKEIKKPLNALSSLAFRGLMQSKVTFSCEDVEKESGDRKTTDEIINIGLLQAHTTFSHQGKLTYYCFFHYSIQELLAAVHLCHKPTCEQISTFKRFFSQPHLSSFFQFYAGMTKLTANRPLSKKILHPMSSKNILDIVKKIVRKENENFTESKPLLVSLLSCLYEAQDASLCKFIAEQLKGNLDLQNTSLTPINCLSVGYFLYNVCRNKTKALLCKANLSSCSIDDHCCKHLMRGLCRCDAEYISPCSPLELDLTYNSINENGAICLAAALENCNTFCKVSLGSHVSTGCMNIGSFGVNAIASALVTNTSLTELSLSGCSFQITRESGEAVQRMLEANNSLQVLTLSYNNPCLLDSGIQYFTDGLKLNTSLKVINLSNCGVTSTTTKYLAEAVKENNSLLELNLSFNDIGDEGVAYFESLGSLNSLNISHCGISDLGIKSLSQILSQNSTLNKLHIRDNQLITDEGVSFLTEALDSNPSHMLQTLSIPWNLNMSGAVKALKKPK